MTLSSYHSRQVALATVGFLVGGIFIAIAGVSAIDMLRIGEPHAVRRATMLVVSAISITAAALGAGWAIGRKLEKRPKSDGDYHLLSFDQTVEASAFMAALSRFMASPAGVTIWPDMRTYEVWTRPMKNGAQLFLSDGAFAMAKEAFSPVPTSQTVRGKEIPRGVMLSLTSFGVAPMGVDEMSQRLEQSS